MSVQSAEPVAYPFGVSEGLTLDERYAAIRDSDGAARVQLPYGDPAWLITRYADARFVFGDPRFSRGAAVERDAPRLTELHGEGGLLSSDPPDHSRLHRLVGRAFTNRRAERMRAGIARLAGKLVAGMTEQGAPADLVQGLAVPLPTIVICDLFGVPQEDRREFRAWSEAALSINGLSPDEVARNLVKLQDYITELVARRRAEPQDDLISQLATAAGDEDARLSEEELIELCVILLVAGHETTASQITNAVMVLLDHPGHWDRLLHEPELLPAAVEELMRFIPISTSSAFPRYATEDVQVGEVTIRAGEAVLVAIGAANRDGLRFADPDKLEFERPDNRHIGFGHGIHLCLGAPLARIELQEALRAVLAELPRLRLAGDLEWKTDTLIRGARKMPVTW